MGKSLVKDNRKNIYKSLLINLLILVLFSQQVRADENGHEQFLDEARVLNELTLFLGTNNGFELDRNAMRIEAGVIIVRLLGMENEAKEKKYDHPFNDVPVWADNYIGYLYKMGLTKGISSSRYGSELQVTPKEFLTFCLRSLGYDDTKGDFLWTDSLEKALNIGLIDYRYYEYLVHEQTLFRDDVVAILFNQLNQKFNNSKKSFIEFLISNEICSFEQALDLGVYQQPFSFSVTGIVQELQNEQKPIVVASRNQVNYCVFVPLSDVEADYVSIIVIKDENGYVYECVLTPEIYSNNEVYRDINIGEEIHVYGQLFVNLIKKEPSIRSFFAAQ